MLSQTLGLAASVNLAELSLIILYSNFIDLWVVSGTAIVQYAQGPDGQLLIPAGTAYQLNAISGHNVVMATGGGGVGEEASRKRELRLLKNR